MPVDSRETVVVFLLSLVQKYSEHLRGFSNGSSLNLESVGRILSQTINTSNLTGSIASGIFAPRNKPMRSYKAPVGLECARTRNTFRVICSISFGILWRQALPVEIFSSVYSSPRYSSFAVVRIHDDESRQVLSREREIVRWLSEFYSACKSDGTNDHAWVKAESGRNSPDHEARDSLDIEDVME